jgi:hypothetical protein
MRAQTRAENPLLASCCIAPFVIAGSPFRPPSFQLAKPYRIALKRP